MATYSVTITFTGSLNFYGVEANSEQEAIQKAMASNFTMEIMGEDGEIFPDHQGDIGEFEMHEQIVDGNVFYGCQNSAWVKEE